MKQNRFFFGHFETEPTKHTIIAVVKTNPYILNTEIYLFDRTYFYTPLQNIDFSDNILQHIIIKTNLFQKKPQNCIKQNKEKYPIQDERSLAGKRFILLLSF